MKTHTLLIILTSVTISLNAQNFISQAYTKVIVTDINYTLRCFEGVNEELFPLYFYHQEFIDDIQSDIGSYISEKFRIDTVLFLNPGTVNDKISLMPVRTKAKQISESEDKRTLCLAVETTLQFSGTYLNVSVYHFITRVRAFSKGEQVYKFTNRIPFTPILGDDISGMTVLGEQDFYALYFEGLKMAFEGQVKKAERWYIPKPPTPYYEAFVSQSNKYYLVSRKNVYLYGTSLDSLKETIVFSDKFFNGIDGEVVLDNILGMKTVQDRYYLINKRTNEEYSIKILASGGKAFNFFDVTSGADITIKKSDKEDAGSFHYSYGLLEGNFKDKNYRIDWKPEFHSAELFVDGELMMLINELKDRKVLFLHNSYTEIELADIFNLAFIYDFAAEAQNRVNEKAAND